MARLRSRAGKDGPVKQITIGGASALLALSCLMLSSSAGAAPTKAPGHSNLVRCANVAKSHRTVTERDIKACAGIWHGLGRHCANGATVMLAKVGKVDFALRRGYRPVKVGTGNKLNLTNSCGVATTTPTSPPVASAGIQIGPGPQTNFTVQPQPAAGSCHYTYVFAFPLPDRRCTPGAINPQVTQSNVVSTICKSGYTSTIRPPEDITEKEKAANAPAYSYRGSFHTAEYDHLISLELGGDPNDPANLWVEPNDRSNATSTSNTKDVLENRLNSLVCAGEITLATAQAAIAINWVVAYGKYVTTPVAPVTGTTTTAPRATTATQPPPPPATTPPATTPPVTTPPVTTPSGCHPLSSGGNCYKAGELCSAADHGLTGVAGNGETITCEDNDGWRWEPT
jgi:hypothetical protein